MSERKIKFLTGCKTYGITDLQLHNVCDDPNCRSCSNFIKAFKEEVKKYVDSNSNSLPKI